VARTSFFATCAPGLEPLLHAELTALRVARVERQVGGCYFEGDLADARRANLWLRMATRVLLRVSRFPCPDEDALYAGAQAIDWSRFLVADGSLRVDAQARDSQLAHTRFVEQRVKDAIVDRFRERTGRRPDVDREAPDLFVHVHLFGDRCTLSVDTSGQALHRRGWRRHQGRAPLAETLAAALVRLSEWDERAPLLDPFCGSGTIAIEAALSALRIAPGLSRTGFAFERWPGHDGRAWEREKVRARDERRSAGKLRILASDVDPQRVAQARANAEAAGVAELVELEVADACAFSPRRGWNAWIVANLPYGERVGAEADLEVLYPRFGERLREYAAGYHAALLCPPGRLARSLGLVGLRAHTFHNGGLECRLLLGRIEAS